MMSMTLAEDTSLWECIVMITDWPSDLWSVKMFLAPKLLLFTDER